MKLSKRLLMPIVVVAFLAMGFCGAVYYRVMYREVHAIYENEMHATLTRLEEKMALTMGVNELVMERVDVKNLALAQIVAEYVKREPERYADSAQLQTLAAMLGVDVVRIVAEDGLNVAGTHERHIGSNLAEKENYHFLFDHMRDTGLAVVMPPEVNSAGTLVQYYIVNRADGPGLVMAGFEYSVASILGQTFTDGLNPEFATVGAGGYAAILSAGYYAAHPDESRVGEDVSGEAWYAVIVEHDDLARLEIDGTEYLVGHLHYANEMILLALLPYAEIEAPLQDVRVFTVTLVILGAAAIVVAMYLSLRRNIIRPLAALSDGMSRVARGNLNVKIEGSFSGEMETLRQDVNRTVAQLRSRQDYVLRNFPGVLWTCDAEGLGTLIAGSYALAAGCREEDVIGKSIVAASRVFGGEEVASLVEETFATMQPQRLYYVRPGGQALAVSTSLMYDSNGGFAGLVGVGVDVTDLHELQQRLMQTTAEAKRANEAKSEFLARMSHEIRTPMNAIVGMTTIAQRSRDDGKRVQYCLDKIETASDQLLALINDILDMSKIEANKFELSVNEFDFEHMLQSVAAVIETKAGGKQQEFVIDFNGVFARNVLADEMRLSQVLLNLLSNAVKFTPDKGSIVLKVRCEEVDKSFGRFTFEVRDNGIGISDEHQKRLFTSAFEQGDGSITRRYGGTGLGLAISRNLVHMMGGELAVDSSLGGGSTFTFAVNLKWGNKKGTRDFVQKLPLGDARILVIDDSADVRLYFDSILTGYGLLCDTAGSGPEGIEQVMSAVKADKPYSLVFVDWMMPGMDGIETARHIKSLAPPETIVIMISVVDWSEIEREAKSIGVDKFLPKPVLPTVLFESIVGWLNKAEARNAPIHTPEPEGTVFAGKTILVAEDIAVNQEILIGLLEGTGIEVVCAASGEEAVAAWREDPARFDAVLMDIQMPGMDGYEATQKIRQSGLPRGTAVPIIAMTANAFNTDVQRCLAAGMNSHIAKPISTQDLLQKLREALA